MTTLSPIVVAFPVWNRADLLTEVLAGWSKVRGVEDAILWFHVEPSCEESLAACEAVRFAATRVEVNPERLGHARQVYKSMTRAFDFSGYAIQALDDYVPATDLLELHAWHREHYGSDDTVLGLSSSRDVPAPDLAWDTVWRCQLIGGLTGFHAHKWRWLADRWAEATDNGWWEWVNSRFLQAGPRLDMLFPSLSRAEDIGNGRGAYQNNVLPQPYREVQGWRERATGFSRWYEELPG